MGEGEKDCSLFIESDGTHEKFYEVRIIENNTEISDLRIRRLAAAVKGVEKAFVRTEQAIEDLSQSLRLFAKVSFDLYPNKRVVWLALHHKKRLVRKRNMKRIREWLRREGIYDGSGTQ